MNLSCQGSSAGIQNNLSTMKKIILLLMVFNSIYVTLGQNEGSMKYSLNYSLDSDTIEIVIQLDSVSTNDDDSCVYCSFGTVPCPLI